jgi:hypothetical protein
MLTLYREVRKEVTVRTPYKALEYWYNLKPDLFIREHWYVSRNGI